jgi:hypothetical protein
MITMMRFFCTLQDCERCPETYVNYVLEQDTTVSTTKVLVRGIFQSRSA